MLSSSSRLITFLGCVVLLCTIAASQTVLPECYSSTEEYIHKQLTVPVQPQESVLVQRFEGPEIKIFCITFEEEGPSCGSGAAPVLCSRKKDDISAGFVCETLSDYTDDANAKITRGTINGDNMIWLLKWDGASKAPQCFPRAVRTRVLAFVRGKEVASVVVFIVLLIITLLAIALMIAGAAYFFKDRYTKIDNAGATTIGGPKQSFQGPQLSVAEGGVVKDQTKVYLPVRNDNGALSDMNASKFGNLSSQQMSRGATRVEMGNKGPGRRASPPAPGDGVEDDALRSRIEKQRRHGRGMPADEDQFSDYDGYSSANNSRRGGRQQHARRDQKPKSMEDERTPKKGSLFPTQSKWESGADDSNYYPDDYSGGDPAMMPSSFGGPPITNSVKYVPQWMGGSFGKGGLIPEVGDGEEDQYEGYGPGRDYESGQRAGYQSRAPESGSKTFGRYKKPMTAAEKENSVFASGSTPRGKGPQSGGPQGGQTPRSALKRRNVPGVDDYDRSVNFRQGDSSPATNRGANSGQKRFNPREHRADREAEINDSFRRDGARLHTSNPQMPLQDTFNRSGVHQRDSADLDGLAPSPTHMRCAHCKVPLGTGNDPIYCQVTGELHH